MNPSVKVTKDNTKAFNEIIESFKFDKVLVGIPDGTTRTSDENTPINNAALLAINEFGSPLNNIPPRPVMQIGLMDAKDAIAEQFKKAAQAALKKGVKGTDDQFNRAGMIAANSIKRVINNQKDIAPPAESTLKSRASQGFKGTKALLMTGSMRNAITWVLRKGL